MRGSRAPARPACTRPVETLAAAQLRSLVTVAYLMSRAALSREESRGGHYRTDFPRAPRRDVGPSLQRRAAAHSGLTTTMNEQQQGKGQGQGKGGGKGDAFVTAITSQAEDYSRWYLDVVLARGTGRLHAGPQGLHDDPAVRLCDLGAHPAAARRAAEGDRPRERLLPAVHPREPADEGSRARRGLRAGSGVGHARRQGEARGEARHPSDLRGHHRDDVRQVAPVLARSAHPHQPVGQRRPLGEGHAAVPADHGVPLAGRPHRARDRGRSRGGDAEDPRRLQGVRRDRTRDAGDRGQEERRREVRGRGEDLLDRGADGRWPRAAGRHVAQPRSEFRQGVRDQVPGPRQGRAACLDHVVGRLDAPHRRADHGARRRQRARAAAQHRTVPGGDRADSPRRLARDRAAACAGDQGPVGRRRRPRDARRPRRVHARLEVRRVGDARCSRAAGDRAQGHREAAGRARAARHPREAVRPDGRARRLRAGLARATSRPRCLARRRRSARSARTTPRATTSSRR